jgi:hypothetical protein
MIIAGRGAAAPSSMHAFGSCGQVELVPHHGALPGTPRGAPPLRPWKTIS